MMKKWIVLTVALALIAALLSGCALPALLFGLMGNTGTRTVEEAPYEYETLDGGDMFYEAEDVANMKMATTATAGYMPMPMPYDYGDFNTEEYAAIDENGFKKVATDPLSTFSADVDTASYCNLRRMLNDGWTPEEVETYIRLITKVAASLQREFSKLQRPAIQI